MLELHNFACDFVREKKIALRGDEIGSSLIRTRWLRLKSENCIKSLKQTKHTLLFLQKKGTKPIFILRRKACDGNG